MIGRLLAFLYAASSGVGLLSYYLAARSGHRLSGWLLVIYSLCLVGAPLFLRMRSDRLWLVLATTAMGTTLVTVVVRLMGDGGMAIATASLYLLVVVPCFYLYSRPVAWLHGVVVGVVALLVLRSNRAFGPAELAMLAGVMATLTLTMSWLVRASDLAEVDYVTGLPNRRGFEAAARVALRDTEPAAPWALVEVDLDGSSLINDTYGHAAADDDVLHALACRWRRVLPESAVLARHGSDEFTLLVRPDPASELDRILASMRSAAEKATFCAGVAWSTQYPDGRSESLTMLKLRADTAVYQAKLRGPGQTVVAAAPRSIRSGQEILDALAAGQFVLYYQPIVDLVTGVVDKAEALVRWHHPEDGLISPDDFIAVAEQTGTIVELGDWIVATAVQDAAGWAPNADGRPIEISVNVSGTELQDPTYARRLLAHARRCGLSTDRMVVELIETDYNTISAVVRANLTALTAAGVSLAIDDFGTGYSNLSRLDQTQVKVLKIDRCFTRAVTGLAPRAPVLAAILAMGRALKLQVVAEGVETPEQAAWLRSRGCSHAQGYLFGKPDPQSPHVDVESLAAG